MATTKLFKSGNSVAVRFPAAFGAKPGMAVEVREEAGMWVVEPRKPERQFIDLTGIAGSAMAPADRTVGLRAARAGLGWQVAGP